MKFEVANIAFFKKDDKGNYELDKNGDVQIYSDIDKKYDFGWVSASLDHEELEKHLVPLEELQGDLKQLDEDLKEWKKDKDNGQV